MQWFYILSDNAQAIVKGCQAVYCRLGQEQDFLQDKPVAGFIAEDSAWSRAIMARIAVLKNLPIVFNKVPDYPSCVIITAKIPKINYSDSVCFVGGRGLGSAAEYQDMVEMAKQCYASVGATRAVVDAGWAQETNLVGQGGLKLSVDYLIAVGVSGAVQHMLGLQAVGSIIAINKEPSAPIFEIADYGIIASWQEVKAKLVCNLFNNEKGDFYVDWCPKRNKGS